MITTRRPSGFTAFVTTSGDTSRTHAARHRGPLGFVKIDGNKRDNRSRLAIFEDREVGGRQSPNRLSILVEHRHVDLHDVNAGAKRGLGSWLLPRCDRDSDGHSDQEAGGDEQSHWSAALDHTSKSLITITNRQSLIHAIQGSSDPRIRDSGLVTSDQRFAEPLFVPVLATRLPHFVTSRYPPVT